MAGDAGPIEITVTFSEKYEDEWPDEIASALGDIIVFDDETLLREIRLRVTSTPAGPGRTEEYDWTFLDGSGLPFKTKHFNLLARLQRLRPYYYLNTIRDASREFSKRSTFFSPFISDPTFGDDTRDQLIESLESINQTVMDSHASFETLRMSLNAATVVIRQAADSVKIEAVPARLSDLLSNTQISFQNRNGAVLPVDKQGSGAQSLSVLQLFHAFVAAKLTSLFDPLSAPILAIEEPEAHLHPSAARLVWSLLSGMPGQRIITSHSGDLLSEVPLSAIRRMKTGSDGNISCSRIESARFSEQEMRHINYHVRRTRGELFFANAWLLVEGKTEASSLPEFAKARGQDLISAGVRIIEYAQGGGPAPYIKLADMLGIAWHCLCDGDAAGLKNRDIAVQQIGNREPQDYITLLDPGNYESFMCKHGFFDCYEPYIALQKRLTITEPEGSDEYFIQVSRALIDGCKEEVAYLICDEIHRDRARLPGLLGGLITRLNVAATN